MFQDVLYLLALVCLCGTAYCLLVAKHVGKQTPY